MPRGKNPKIKVLHPRINILCLKNLLSLVIALSAVRKATELQTAGKNVSYSLCLRLQVKTAQKIKNQFPNRETDHEKGCLWLLSWF